MDHVWAKMDTEALEFQILNFLAFPKLQDLSFVGSFGF